MMTPTAFFGAELAMHVDPSLSVTMGTAPAIAALPDISSGGHNASQADAAKRPTLVSGAARFDGSNDLLSIDAAAGYGAGTSWTFAMLVNDRIGSASSKYFADWASPRLILAARTSTADKIGYFDTAFRSIADAVAGWQIVLYVFNAGTGKGEIFRGNSAALASLGDGIYVPRTIAGTAALGAHSAGIASWGAIDMASFIIVKSAATVDARDYLWRYLKQRAASGGITL
jgi:hypothetical protein